MRMGRSRWFGSGPNMRGIIGTALRSGLPPLLAPADRFTACGTSMHLQTCHSDRKLPADHDDLLLCYSHPALNLAMFPEMNTAIPDYASTPMTTRVPGPADFLVCGNNHQLAFLASGKAPVYCHKDQKYDGIKFLYQDSNTRKT